MEVIRRVKPKVIVTRAIPEVIVNHPEGHFFVVCENIDFV